MRKTLTVLMFLMSFSAFAGKTIQMNVNKDEKQFIVSLKSNPTTGFQWSVVSYDKDRFKLLDSSYERSKTHLMGAGGYMKFSFSLKEGKRYPEHTVIKFKYSRPWETKGESTVQKVQVNFITAKAAVGQSSAGSVILHDKPA